MKSLFVRVVSVILLGLCLASEAISSSTPRPTPTHSPFASSSPVTKSPTRGTSVYSWSLSEAQKAPLRSQYLEALVSGLNQSPSQNSLWGALFAYKCPGTFYSLYQIAVFIVNNVVQKILENEVYQYMLPGEASSETTLLNMLGNFSGQTTNPLTFSVACEIFAELVKPRTVKLSFADSPTYIITWTTLLGGPGSFNVSTFKSWKARFDGGPVFVYGTTASSGPEPISVSTFQNYLQSSY